MALGCLRHPHHLSQSTHHPHCPLPFAPWVGAWCANKGRQAARALVCGISDGQARCEAERGAQLRMGPRRRGHMQRGLRCGALLQMGALGPGTGLRWGGGAQRGGTWARLRGVDVGKMCGMAMCAPRGPGCVWHMYKGCGQHPVSHGSGMDALGYAHLCADSDFIDVSDSIHNLCKPHLSGLLHPEVRLGVGLGEHAQ